jgi:NitT/TauT family transport system substrate-binding protein
MSTPRSPDSLAPACAGFSMAQKTPKGYRGKISIYTIAGLLVTAALLAGGYAWFARTSPSQTAGPLEQVTIAINTEYAGSCPIFVAQEKGYFPSEGILAVIQPHTTGKAALEAVLRGQAHLGTSADLPIMFAVVNGRPVSVVATIFSTEKDHGIVARRDRGIVAPASLKGKRIGVTLGTSGHFLLDAFLNRQKLSPSEVKTLNLKPEELSAALAQGDVDAVATWEPFLSASLAQLRGNGTIFPGEGVYNVLFNVSGTLDYVRKHPDAMKKFLRALIRGARFCEEAPDAAREIAAKAMKTDLAKLKELWPSYRFNVVLDQGLILALEDQTRWAIKNKLTSRTDMPNYLNHIYLDAVREVAPAAVTVIH